MSQPLRYQLWIAAAAGVIFFTNLWATGLWDMDEALYASCAREMHQRDNLVVPWFNGRMFPEKPPLMFWTMIAGFDLFGVNEFGARFFSAVMGVATALIAFHIGRLWFNARVGFWTGLITASTIVFTVSARAATVDSALTFVTAAAMLMFVLAKGPGARDQEPGDERPAASAAGETGILNPLRRDYAILMYAFIGLAVLAKGPVGMALPLAAIGLYVLIEGGWRRAFRSAWEMRPLTAIIVIGAVALPWYVMVGLQTQGEWLRKFFMEFNLRPFKQPILGHGDAGSLQQVWAAIVSLLYYFYHVPAIFFGFFPWSIFLGPTLIYTIQSIRRKPSPLVPRPSPLYGCLFATCWFGVWLVFWSVCKTKLPHYLLPAYPALALLTACWIDRWLEEKKRSGVFSLRWLRSAWLSAILAGLGIVIAVPIAAHYYLPGEAIIGLIGLIPIGGGAWCWRLTAQEKRQQAMCVYAVMSALLLTATFGFAALRVDRHQNAEPMMDAIRADCGTLHPPIATYRFFRESTVYYSGRPVTRCEGDRPDALLALLDFIDEHQRPLYVITTDRQEAEIEEAFSGWLEVIFRHPRFLSPGEMVVLRCQGRGDDGSTKPDN